MNLRTWYELTAGSHAGPDGYEQFVFWCEANHLGNVERMPSDLWPGFLAQWLGLDVPLKGGDGVEIYETAVVSVEHPPESPIPMGVTWEEFFDAVNKPLFERVLKMADGDKSKAEDWFSELLLCIVSSVHRHDDGKHR